MLNAYADVCHVTLTLAFISKSFQFIKKYTNYNILGASAVVSVDAIAFNSRSFQYYETDKIFQF